MPGDINRQDEVNGAISEGSVIAPAARPVRTANEPMPPLQTPGRPSKVWRRFHRKGKGLDDMQEPNVGNRL